MEAGCKVSVILPTHNRAGSLARSIRSVLSQTYRDLELIVVDDASTDGTAELVSGFDDPRLRYVRHTVNRGAAAARNTGIKRARGNYVAFQDSDDEWLLEKLEKQVAALDQQGEDVGAVYCSFVRCERGWASRIPSARIRMRDGDISRQVLYGNFVGTPTMLVRRACLERTTFIEALRAFEDWELVLQLARQCRFTFIDEPLVLVHTSAHSVTTDLTAGRRALDLIAERHSVLPRAELAALLCTIGQLQCALGDAARGRSYLARSARIRPWNPQLWLAWALSWMGVRAYAAIHRWTIRTADLVFAGAANPGEPCPQRPLSRPLEVSGAGETRR